jgi:beta-galactosidase
MNKILSITLLAVFFYSSWAPVAAQRRHINFDDNWRFAFGHAASAEKDFNYGLRTIFSKSGGAAGTAIDPAFKDSTWRTLNLPHDWAVELPFVNSSSFEVESHGYKPVGGLFPETSIGWYRKHFKVQAADSGQRFQIQFDGVFRDASFWLNGFYLGNNKSGYTGVSYDITDVINYQKENVLVVRADATQYEGWFYEGAGIYRHVWLNSYANTHIAQDGVFAYANINGSKAQLTVETEMASINHFPANGIELTTQLVDRNGKLVASATKKNIKTTDENTSTLTQVMAINNPRLWTLEDPYLYRVITQLKLNGQLVDEQVTRFGFRTIEIRPDGLFLNGKYIKITGTNNHQDHAGVGAALPDYLQYYRISQLKKLGSNAYRTSHHAPTPELLDACDSLGMLVMDEQRLLNSSPEYLQQFYKLVKRDRSRACVFMWSIGNEEGWIQANSYGKRIAQTYINHLSKLDPTRTCTYAADMGNIFNGINEVIPVRSFNYRQFAVADYHHDHPNQPIIGTEMGSTVTTRGVLKTDSIRAYLPDQDITAPWWASRAETWWSLAQPNNYWLGGFVWTGFDYRGEPTPFKWPNINAHFGIMDVCGFPKNIYYYYKSWWTDKDVLHISPHWNHHNEWGQPKKQIEVWVNSNADEVELLLNGHTLGKKIMPRNGHLNWNVTFEPGKLQAIGYKKGRRLAAVVETTGPAAEVVLTPYKTTMLADGKDATVMNITVVDKQGREVPDADNMIRFSIQGDARIIGVGNGDPSSHEPDKCPDGAWQRSLFNGKCQVIVQSGHNPGIIKITAAASGLWDGATDIVTIAAQQVNTITIDKQYQLSAQAAQPRPVDKMLGADISFLPELEANGTRFSDKGITKDAIEILKDHGFNYVRLRLFNDPARDSGYSPGKGFCNLPQTLAMAKRVKAAGLKLLLDFHYSDYWADPGKQYKPYAWRNLPFTQLKAALYDYTRQVMEALKAQGTTPDMVQIGNEINHGIVWPEGSVANIDQTAQLINAGTAAVKAVDEKVVMMLHVALGGQNDESVFFIDNMLARGVHFDVIGQSYYPKWHGTLDDLDYNLQNLAARYAKDVIVVEYSALKKEVNKIAFGIDGGRGKGTCIWEPLSTWEKFFEADGKSNNLLLEYDELSEQFIKTNQ